MKEITIEDVNKLFEALGFVKEETEEAVKYETKNDKLHFVVVYKLSDKSTHIAQWVKQDERWVMTSAGIASPLWEAITAGRIAYKVNKNYA